MKSLSKIWVVSLFILAFKVAFPNAPAYALSSLQTCAENPDCVALEKDVLAPAVSTPTDAGVSTTVTDSSGASVNAASDSVVVEDTGSGSGLRNGAWYYWSQSQNHQAQNYAQEKYCAATPSDSICSQTFTSSQTSTTWGNYVCSTYQIAVPPEVTSYSVKSSSFVRAGWSEPHYLNGGNSISIDDPDVPGRTLFWSFTGTLSQGVFTAVPSAYSTKPPSPGCFLGRIDFTFNTPAQEWKNWPVDKRIAAVALLSPSDWQQLITSMPLGGTLPPGVTINAPSVVFPGTNDPNAPGYQHLPQIMDGPYPWSGQAPSPDSEPLRGNPNNLSLNSDQLKTLQERPNFARYVRNGNDTQQDSNTGCISATIPGHLGDNPQKPEPALYATQLSGSPNDYFVLSHTGLGSTFDGLTTGTRHVWEAKYDYGFLFNSSYPQDDKDITISDMFTQAFIENAVAQECNYQLTWAFSNGSVANAFEEMWQNDPDYPQDVRYIPYSGQ